MDCLKFQQDLAQLIDKIVLSVAELKYAQPSIVYCYGVNKRLHLQTCVHVWKYIRKQAISKNPCQVLQEDRCSGLWRIESSNITNHFCFCLNGNLHISFKFVPSPLRLVDIYSIACIASYRSINNKIAQLDCHKLSWRVYDINYQRPF